MGARDILMISLGIVWNKQIDRNCRKYYKKIKISHASWDYWNEDILLSMLIIVRKLDGKRKREMDNDGQEWK